jgi:hypothetical protein
MWKKAQSLSTIIKRRDPIEIKGPTVRIADRFCTSSAAPAIIES